jgi:hypothetical protein
MLNDNLLRQKDVQVSSDSVTSRFYCVTFHKVVNVPKVCKHCKQELLIICLVVCVI